MSSVPADIVVFPVEVDIEMESVVGKVRSVPLHSAGRALTPSLPPCSLHAAVHRLDGQASRGGWGLALHISGYAT